MKYWGQLRGILLCGLGGLGVGMLLCGLLGLSPAGVGILGLTGLLGGAVGAIALEKKNSAAGALLGLMLLAVAGLGIWWFRDALVVIFVVLTGLLSAGALLVSGYGFYTPLGIWSLVLLALSVPAAGKLGLTLPGTAALLLALGLTLDGLRDSSMRKSQLRGRDSAHLENPGKLLEHSYGLLAIFALGAVVLGLLTYGFSHYLGKGISALAGGSVAGVSGILRWIVWLITFIIQWFSDLFPDLPEDGPGEGISRDIDQPIYTGGDGSWLSTLLLVILLVTLAIGLCVATGAALLGARKRAKKQEAVSDFVDEIERLERPRGFLHRKTRGRQKLSDFRSPNMRLRFVFQQLLRKKQKTRPDALTRTPNELKDDTVRDEATVIAAYNRVKYAQGDVSPEELRAAERYLKQL
jgi:hypothetical protein